jgi:hypothetical protein
MNKIEMLREIKNKRLPVVISGAGVVGKVLLSVCRQEGIPVDCFCDSSTKVARSDFCGMEVVYTPDLKRRHKDATILISVAAIGDVVELLQKSGFTNWYAGGLLLEDVDVAQRSPGAEIDTLKFAIENCVLCHRGFMDRDRLFLRSVDIIITERCSLRCKDCSNLMQYYRQPKNLDTAMLLKSIAALCSVVDEVMDFRVIGGEALMNRHWPLIVKRLTEEPKARRVVLYSNGTILPKRDDIPYLKNNKVLVIITDYGTLSKKRVELVKVLKGEGIAHRVLKMDDWLDCSSIIPHHRGIEGNQDIYRRCCAKNMVSLSDGKLFRCPYSANAARLSAVPNYTADYIDLFQEPLDAANIRRTKEKLREFILHKDYLETCDFCSGRPLAGVEVRPAMQVDKPLAYRRYLNP